MRSSGRWQRRDECGSEAAQGSQLLYDPWTSTCALVIFHTHGRAKLRLARSAQHGKRNFLVIPGVEQTPKSTLWPSAHALVGHFNTLPCWLDSTP